MGEPARIGSLKTLGKYTLIEKLSDGNLGPVYRSFDQKLDLTVEIRVLSDGIKWDADIMDLFRKECESVARLQHPNIASLMEVNIEGMFPFIVMESPGDSNLKKLIEQKSPMSFEAKIAVMIQVAEGLGYAHKNGILHRNLCPDNIYLSEDGCVKIRDFAIAHVLMRHLPHPGVRWGAPIYLSPEQIGHKPCSARSDIFALGMIFYEFLTGVHPFYDPDGNKTLDNILQYTEIPTFEQYPEFHPRIWQILKTCLAKNPDDRYADINELLEAYRGLLKEMSDDAQLILGELQASFSSLRIAAERPDAPQSVVSLFEKARNVLHKIENADYMQLDRLITDLMKTYPEIGDASGERNVLDSMVHPRNQPEEQPVIEKKDNSREQEELLPPREDAWEISKLENPAASDLEREEARIPEQLSEKVPAARAEDTASVPETGVGCAGRKNATESAPVDPIHLCNEEESGNSDPKRTAEDLTYGRETTPPESAGLNDNSPQMRVALRWKKCGFSKRTYRTAVILLSILLIVVAVHIVQEKTEGTALRGIWQNLILDPLKTVKASALNNPSFADTGGVSFRNVEITHNKANFEYENAILEELEKYPTVPSIAVLREEIDSGTESFGGRLSVYSLDSKASILLDGKRVDDDGEIRDKSIPIGHHTITVEKDGYLVASRNQKFLEGQEVVFVYDLAGRSIRSMVEADRKLLSQREMMEESYRKFDQTRKKIKSLPQN